MAIGEFPEFRRLSSLVVDPIIRMTIILHCLPPCWLCYRSHWPGARSPTTTTTTCRNFFSFVQILPLLDIRAVVSKNSRSLSSRLYRHSPFVSKIPPAKHAIPHPSLPLENDLIFKYIHPHTQNCIIVSCSFPNQMDRKLSSCSPFRKIK
jgi:hypothetical protein